jgi:hypothetical protein
MLEDDVEQMLLAIEDTLEDNVDSEVRACLRGRTTAETAAESFLVPFVIEDLKDLIVFTNKGKPGEERRKRGQRWQRQMVVPQMWVLRNEGLEGNEKNEREKRKKREHTYD